MQFEARSRADQSSRGRVAKCRASSSRIASLCSGAGSGKRSSRSGRPMVSTKCGQKRPTWSIMRTIGLPSAQTYGPTSGFGARGMSPDDGSMKPYISAAVMSGDSTHTAVPRSETSTSQPSPVRSRRKRAAATPPAVQQLAASGFGQVQADAALVPAELLDDEVPARRAGDQPAGDEAADRIAEARVLDLDHLRAPVAEHGPRRGHEAPLGHLEHADAVQDAGHGPTLGRAARG